MINILNNFADEISEKLLEENHKKRIGRVAILAGNEVLAPTGEYSPEFGIYPESALEISKRVIENVRQKIEQIFLFTLINDWKKLMNTPNPEEIRREYWSNPRFDLDQTIGDIYKPHLLPGKGIGSATKKDLNAHLVNGRISEQRLHNEFGRLKGKGNNVEVIDDAFNTVELPCSSDDKSCDTTKCASEYVMTIRHLHENNIQRLVALLPGTCKIPIERGTELIKFAKGIFIPNLKAPIKIDNHYLFNVTQSPSELLSLEQSRNPMMHEIR